MQNDELHVAGTVPASPKELYSAFLDPVRHAAMTGQAASGSAEIGGRFSAGNGYIESSSTSLVPHSKIVQQWRTADFPPQAEPSLLEITLKPVQAGTRLSIEHRRIPDGQGHQYLMGWINYYLKAINDHFGGAEATLDIEASIRIDGQLLNVAAESFANFPASQDEPEVDDGTLELIVLLPGSPKQIFKAWLDPKRHAKFTGAPCELTEKGVMRCQDGYILSKTVAVTRDERIVQRWRTKDFPRDSRSSRLEITLEPITGGTRMTMKQSNCPPGHAAVLESSWMEHYFEPLARYLRALNS